MLNIDLEKAPAIKSLLGFLVPLPFWYIALHLFHSDFFYQNDFVLLAAYCICLSLSAGLFFSNILTVVLEEDLKTRPQDETKGILNLYVTAAGVMLQLLWQIILIFVLYSWELASSREVSFYLYVILFFFPLIIANLRATQVLIKRRKN